jgi:hypothetical protein
MRKAVGAEGLFSKPTDLRFLQPTSIGFLTRDGKQCLLQNNSECHHIIVVKEYDPPSEGAKMELLRSLRDVADHVNEAAEESDVLTFWVLEYDPEYQDHGVKVIACFADKTVREVHESSQVMASFQ